MDKYFDYALSIECFVRSLGNDLGTMGGVIDADYIQYGGMVSAISSGLSVHYKIEHKRIIDEYLKKIRPYNGVNLKDIGENQLKIIIDELQTVVNAVISQ